MKAVLFLQLIPSAKVLDTAKFFAEHEIAQTASILSDDQKYSIMLELEGTTKEQLEDFIAHYIAVSPVVESFLNAFVLTTFVKSQASF